MRKLLLSLLVVILSLSLIAVDAEARRFGGGKSFGTQRNVSSFSRTNTPRAANTANPSSFKNKILPALTGLALGGLLASLFMGHGFGAGILSWLLVIGVAFFIWTLIRNRFQPANQSAKSHWQANTAQTAMGNTYTQNSQTNAWRVQSDKQLADFDEINFLRQAKSQFIRLQAAYDSANSADIREFTTPEVFAEIQLQLQERGTQLNHTEVVSIDAQLLDVADESQTMVASVLFSGQVREAPDAAPTIVKEVWHFNKDLYRPVWVVAGIQQV